MCIVNTLYVDCRKLQLHSVTRTTDNGQTAHFLFIQFLFFFQLIHFDVHGTQLTTNVPVILSALDAIETFAVILSRNDFSLMEEISVDNDGGSGHMNRRYIRLGRKSASARKKNSSINSIKANYYYAIFISIISSRNKKKLNLTRQISHLVNL